VFERRTPISAFDPFLKNSYAHATALTGYAGSAQVSDHRFVFANGLWPVDHGERFVAVLLGEEEADARDQARWPRRVSAEAVEPLAARLR
jgi:hypothetical protein